MIQIMPIFIIDLKDPFFKVEPVTENVSLRLKILETDLSN